MGIKRHIEKDPMGIKRRIEGDPSGIKRHIAPFDLGVSIAHGPSLHLPHLVKSMFQRNIIKLLCHVV